jgi:N-methylhydantoinase B
LTTPRLPSNEGCFRPLEVICPPGKLLHAVRPAALGDWAVPFGTVIDTIFRSLADAMPQSIPAATRGDARGIMLAGFDPKKRKYFRLHFPHFGGHGGRPHRDAPSPRCAIQQGNMYTVPVCSTASCKTRWCARVACRGVCTAVATPWAARPM